MDFRIIMRVSQGWTKQSKHNNESSKARKRITDQQKMKILRARVPAEVRKQVHVGGRIGGYEH